METLLREMYQHLITLAAADSQLCVRDLSQQAPLLPRKKKCWQLCCVQLFVTLWAVACQIPLFMDFSKKEYWSGLPFPSPGDLCNPGIKPGSPALQTDFLQSEPLRKPSAQEVLHKTQKKSNPVSSFGNTRGWGLSLRDGVATQFFFFFSQ